MNVGRTPLALSVTAVLGACATVAFTPMKAGLLEFGGSQKTILRVSQKEPFDILDFTPSVSLIANMNDRSWSLIPELLYAGIKNVELRARVALSRGDAESEYGERAVRSRVELRARLYF